MEKSAFIRAYSRHIINGEASFFFGAGFSKNYNLPLWKDLIKKLKDELGIDKVDNYDYALIAQYYQNATSATDLYKLVKEQIDDKTVNTNETNDVLDQLLRLKPKNIWTTNYDTIIEKQCEKLKINYEVIAAEKDLLKMNKKEVTIYKLGGTIKNAEKLFLTKIDYENYARPTLLALLTRELLIKHFLFIGYSFNDGIVKKQMQETLKILKRGENDPLDMPAHYAIVFKENNCYFKHYINDLEKNYNIKTITVEDTNEFFALISDLLQEIRKHYIFISGSFDDFKSNIKSQYIYALCNKLSIKLIDNDFCIVNAVGMNIGNYICGTALAQINKKKYIKSNKKLIVHPLPTNEKGELIDSTSAELRNELIAKCGTIIFIDGNKDDNSGTRAEFNIAKGNQLNLVPIANTGGAAKKIYEELDFSQHPLKNHYERLNINPPNTMEEIDDVTDIIVQAVLDILNNKQN